jgi:hypothetical protein
MPSAGSELITTRHILTNMPDLASLSLFAATPEQVLASRKGTFAQWAKTMTMEEYLHRDICMETMDHAVNGKLTTW